MPLRAYKSENYCNHISWKSKETMKNLQNQYKNEGKGLKTTTFATITNYSFVDCTVSFHAIFRYAVSL